MNLPLHIIHTYIKIYIHYILYYLLTHFQHDNCVSDQNKISPDFITSLPQPLS